MNGRIAVYGGDARQRARWNLPSVVFFQSPRDGGNGELRRIEDSLRSGGIAEVIILSKWNGHAGTRKVRRLCRTLRVPFRLV